MDCGKTWIDHTQQFSIFLWNLGSMRIGIKAACASLRLYQYSIASLIFHYAQPLQCHEILVLTLRNYHRKLEAAWCRNKHVFFKLLVQWHSIPITIQQGRFGYEVIRTIKGVDYGVWGQDASPQFLLRGDIASKSSPPNYLKWCNLS